MTLIELPLTEFVNKLGDNSPTPGGGSVAALAGCLGAALCAMVARLTLGTEKYRGVREDMERVCDASDKLARRLLVLVDKDTEAYNQVMDAFKLPKKNEDQKATQRQTIQSAVKQAALVPMETLQTMADLVELVGEALDKGNPNRITDAGVAAQLTRAAAMGAAYNVQINLLDISNNDFSARLEKDMNELVSHIMEAVDRLEKIIEQNLG